MKGFLVPARWVEGKGVRTLIKCLYGLKMDFKDYFVRPLAFSKLRRPPIPNIPSIKGIS